jgi:protein-L-isoaspartate(D-aspartate) O-methyltransferase
MQITDKNTHFSSEQKTMNFTDTFRHQGLRKQLVNILVEKGIKNKSVLDAIGRIPRHVFLDNAFLEHAYQDKAFPIDEGQTISQPYTVAFQTELLEVKKGDKVLEIGTGSGYQSCVLLEMGAKLYTIEYHSRLFEKAKYALGSLKYKAQFFCMDGTLGLPQFAPYDKIIVTAGAPSVPETLMKQLKVGGHLVIPVGDNATQTMLRITRRSDNEFEKQQFGTFRFVPLVGKHGW